MRIAYVHVLPLEYYPPACNFLDILGRRAPNGVRAFTTSNRKSRAPYVNPRVEVVRGKSPDPAAPRWRRLLRVLAWHLKTAISLRRFKPNAIMYVEPHSAIAVWIYFALFRGKGRLFVHHHEYYEPADYLRPGMSLPRLGSRLERSDLFPRAEWISQTNPDRLRLARALHPEVAGSAWQDLPNYPPSAWTTAETMQGRSRKNARLRLIYVGSASFVDTYIEQIVRWAAEHSNAVDLHVCGYNVAGDVWAWLDQERFANVTFDTTGFEYDDLPGLLKNFDVGLVLYKGNTTNFVYNVPNKVFEYLRCGLEVWYPAEMKGIANFSRDRVLPIREVDFAKLAELTPIPLEFESDASLTREFTAERAFEPLLQCLGLNGASGPEPAGSQAS